MLGYLETTMPNLRRNSTGENTSTSASSTAGKSIVILCVYFTPYVCYSELTCCKCCEGSINIYIASWLVLGLARIHHRQCSWLLGKLTGAIISSLTCYSKYPFFFMQRMLRIWRVHMKNRRKHNLWLLVYRISTPPLPGVLTYLALGLVMWTCRL